MANYSYLFLAAFVALVSLVNAGEQTTIPKIQFYPGTDMDEDMKDQLTFAFYALESRYSEYDDSKRCLFLKEKFDKTFNGKWTCVIGKELSSVTTFKSGTSANFKYDGKQFIMFQNAI